MSPMFLSALVVFLAAFVRDFLASIEIVLLARLKWSAVTLAAMRATAGFTATLTIIMAPDVRLVIAWVLGDVLATGLAIALLRRRGMAPQ